MEGGKANIAFLPSIFPTKFHYYIYKVKSTASFSFQPFSIVEWI